MNMTCFPDEPAPYEVSIFTFVLSIVLSLFIVFGNGAIAVTVIKDPLKKLHNPFNYFVINLAVSDLIVGVTTLPLSAYTHYKESTQSIDLNWVKTLHMSYFISASASLLSLIVLSLDRLIAIIYPSNYKTYMSKKRCIIASVVVWIASFSFPFIYFEWNYIGYLMFFAHSTIIVGLLTLIVVSVSVRKFLKRQSNKMIMNISVSSPLEVAANFAFKELLLEKKVTRTFLIILTAFIGCYIPAVVMIYILNFCVNCDCSFRHVLRDLLILLICASSCVNPFVYAMKSTHIRNSIKIMFCRHFQKVSQVTPTSIAVEGSTSHEFKRGGENNFN